MGSTDGGSCSRALSDSAFGGRDKTCRWKKTACREYGYPEEVQNIVERHIGAGLSEDEAIKLGLPKKSYIPQTIEEKIVAHADNLISGTKEVDVDFDIAKWKRKIDEPEEDIKRLIELDNELIKAFEDE